MSQRDLTNDFLANNTVAQQGRAADENPCVGGSNPSRMNGNDNSRHVRVWFAKLFCLGSSVGRAAVNKNSSFYVNLQILKILRYINDFK